MSRGNGGFGPLLASATVVRFKGVLARSVSKLAFDTSSSPAFLYASGKRGRVNPAGVRCIYFSESEQVAAWECRYGLRGSPAELQPRVTFHARVSLANVLDLGDAAVCSALGITTADLVAPWRLTGRATKLQRLGKAIDAQRGVVAARFPSVAATAFGGAGSNYVIFLSPLHAPDTVRVVGPGGATIETLP